MASDDQLPLFQQVLAEALDGEAALQRASDWFRRVPMLEGTVGQAIRDAIDQVIDAPRTGRWSLDQVHPQELAYLGVRVEIVLRAALSLPRGRYGQDFDVDGNDVDCKWSKNWGGWQIPPEAVDHLCLIVWADDATTSLALGIVQIQEGLLVGGNRDKKRTIKRPEGLAEVVWLLPRGTRLPPNVLLRLPDADRAAVLAPTSGDGRMAELFRRCEGVLLKRHVIASVAQQDDPTRRARAMRALLGPDGLEVLCGYLTAQKLRAEELGGPVPQTREHWVCLRTDGTSAARAAESGMAERLWDVA